MMRDRAEKKNRIEAAQKNGDEIFEYHLHDDGEDDGYPGFCMRESSFSSIRRDVYHLIESRRRLAFFPSGRKIFRP